jgi:hypothetical protein
LQQLPIEHVSPATHTLWGALHTVQPLVPVTHVSTWPAEHCFAPSVHASVQGAPLLLELPTVELLVDVLAAPLVLVELAVVEVLLVELALLELPPVDPLPVELPAVLLPPKLPIVV